MKEHFEVIITKINKIKQLK